MGQVPGDFFFSSLGEINAALRARRFTALDLAEASCNLLESQGPKYNAVALVVREDARASAREVDRDIKRQRFRGLLQGVPFGAKDLLAYHGHPTAWGAKPYAAQVFDEDATVLKRLFKAGAILTAKLAMVELAGGGGYRYASASVTGPGLNPWDRTRWSGGSSSGSGAAVAAGLVPFALGSETSGSILTPAAFCGVTGLRPTYGLASRAGAMALSWTLDKIGPLAWYAEDCGHILQGIAGGDSHDPGSAGKSYYYAPQYARPAEQLRAGFAPADFSDHLDEPLRPALNDALNVFRKMGLQTKEAELPDFPYSALVSTIIGAEAGSIFAELIESGKVDELADARQIAGLKAGSEVTAKDYLRAMRVRTMAQAELRQLFLDFDVLIVPTRFSVASKVSDPLDAPSTTRPSGGPRGLRDHIPAGNLAGLPAIALPCGLAGGLPVSICLVGRPFTENLLLSLANRFQKAIPPARPKR
ncbi:MAG: amidase [Bryobacterales bacterium]|nr:amidase [Bryobacterales bacterium]